MTNNLPNYARLDVPDDKPVEEYDHHERRTALWHLMVRAGGPSQINKKRTAERFDVHRSTIYRDLERIGESVADHLGDDAELYTRAIFEDTVKQLREADDWRAKKAAWDVVMDWNEWLAKMGEQYREPTKSKLDVRSRHSEVAYKIVRDGDEEPLPTTSTNGTEEHVDYDDLGFTSAPVTVEVEERGEDGG